MIRENPDREQALKDQLKRMHERFAKVSEQRDRFAGLVNSLACIIIDGDISTNDIDVANDAIEEVIKFID